MSSHAILQSIDDDIIITEDGVDAGDEVSPLEGNADGLFDGLFDGSLVLSSTGLDVGDVEAGKHDTPESTVNTVERLMA